MSRLHWVLCLRALVAFAVLTVLVTSCSTKKELPPLEVQATLEALVADIQVEDFPAIAWRLLAAGEQTRKESFRFRVWNQSTNGIPAHIYLANGFYGSGGPATVPTVTGVFLETAGAADLNLGASASNAYIRSGWEAFTQHWRATLPRANFAGQVTAVIRVDVELRSGEYINHHVFNVAVDPAGANSDPDTSNNEFRVAINQVAADKEPEFLWIPQQHMPRDPCAGGATSCTLPIEIDLLSLGEKPEDGFVTIGGPDQGKHPGIASVRKQNANGTWTTLQCTQPPSGYVDPLGNGYSTPRARCSVGTLERWTVADPNKAPVHLQINFLILMSKWADYQRSETWISLDRVSDGLGVIAYPTSTYADVLYNN